MKKVLFNITTIIFFIFLTELISYNFIYCYLYDYLNSLKNVITKKSFNYPNLMFEFLTYNENKAYSSKGAEFSTRDCKDIPYNPKKKYIVFIGCSYTYGQGIKINQTFNAQVQTLTKRRTFNISQFGNGFTENYHRMISLANSNYMTEQERKNVEYVVFTLMYNHIYRTADFEVAWYLKQQYLKNKDKSFKDKLKYYISKSYFVKLLLIRHIMTKDNLTIKYQQYELLRLYNECMKNFPNSKFILLIYDDLTNYDHKNLEKQSLKPSFWEPVTKQADIQIISTKDLVGDILWQEEYKLKNDPFQYPGHPNYKAWELVAPKFVKKLNL